MQVHCSSCATSELRRWVLERLVPRARPPASAGSLWVVGADLVACRSAGSANAQRLPCSWPHGAAICMAGPRWALRANDTARAAARLPRGPPPEPHGVVVAARRDPGRVRRRRQLHQPTLVCEVFPGRALAIRLVTTTSATKGRAEAAEGDARPRPTARDRRSGWVAWDVDTRHCWSFSA
jgi:hypothetical protein